MDISNNHIQNWKKLSVIFTTPIFIEGHNIMIIYVGDIKIFTIICYVL